MPTPDTIQGVDLPTYDDPPAIPDDVALIWYAMISRGIPRFSNDAALEAAYPAPTEGQVAWIQAEQRLAVFAGAPTDDARWRTLPVQGDVETVPLLTGWGTYTGFAPPRLVRQGDIVSLIGGMAGRTTNAALTALQEYNLAGTGAIPADLCPATDQTENRPGWLQSGTAVSNAQIRVYPDGSIRYVPISTITLTSGSTRGYILVPDMSWKVKTA
ncbi:hypothetical protein [Cellulosimicrobium protaetiae]